jgi:hypothetical protein
MRVVGELDPRSHVERFGDRVEGHCEPDPVVMKTLEVELHPLEEHTGLGVAVWLGLDDVAAVLRHECGHRSGQARTVRGDQGAAQRRDRPCQLVCAALDPTILLTVHLGLSLTMG